MTSSVNIGSLDFWINDSYGTSTERANFYDLLNTFSEMPSMRQALGVNGTAVSSVEII